MRILLACIRIPEVRVCIQLGCIRIPYVSAHILLPKNPNSFSICFFLCFINMLASVRLVLSTLESLFLYFVCFISFMFIKVLICMDTMNMHMNMNMH